MSARATARKFGRPELELHTKKGCHHNIMAGREGVHCALCSGACSVVHGTSAWPRRAVKRHGSLGGVSVLCVRLLSRGHDQVFARIRRGGVHFVGVHKCLGFAGDRSGSARESCDAV